MSYISDFKDLHVSFRSGIITLACVFPLFFIATYLFKPSIIPFNSQALLSDIRFHFLIMLCFSLSIAWYFMNVAISFAATDIVERMFPDKATETQKEYEETTFTLSVVYSFIFLSLIVALCYWTNASYKLFLLCTFGWGIVRTIWIIAAAGFGNITPFPRIEQKKKDGSTQWINKEPEKRKKKTSPNTGKAIAKRKPQSVKPSSSILPPTEG